MVAIPSVFAVLAGSFCSLIPGLCTQSGDCDLSSTTIPLSSSQQTALGPPSSPLLAVGLGFGVQNYTCSSNNLFVSTGAVAEVFDISCIACNDSDLLSSAQNALFNFWNGSDAGSSTIQDLIGALPGVVPANSILAQHYFIDNGAGGISPVWDFRATPRFEGVSDAVFVGKVTASTPDANPANNIPWLNLRKVSGEIADEVYRIFTIGGVPPSSCIGGASQDISVKYVSQYWFFGGSLGLGSGGHSGPPFGGAIPPPCQETG